MGCIHLQLIYRWMDGWMDGLVGGWMDGLVGGCTDKTISKYWKIIQ